MRHYFCTNCWRFIEEDMAFYTCPKCANPKSTKSRNGWSTPPILQPNQKTIQQQRVKKLRTWWRMLDENSLKLCKKHPDEEGTLFCECGMRLSENNAVQVRENGERNAIRIVGSRGSGKTVWLTTMCRSLRSEDTPFDLLGIGDTEMNFSIIETAFLKNKTRPPATKPNANLRFAWCIKDKNGLDNAEYPVLMVHDIAGEVWSNLRHGRVPEDLDHYVTSPGDLIFIIDGARLATDLPEKLQDKTPKDDWETTRTGDDGAEDRIILSNILNYIPQSKRKNMRLALVITKSDRLTHLKDEYPILDCYKRIEPKDPKKSEKEKQNSENQEKLAKLLGIAQRGALVGFGKDFQDFKIFTTSSLGFSPLKDKHIVDEKTLNRAPKPECVADPILWLLTSNGFAYA